jgi:hypothetical protein
LRIVWGSNLIERRHAVSRSAAAAWAFLATLYWAAMAFFYFWTWGSNLVLIAGTGAFLLLCWAIRDGAGARPSGSSFVLAGVSALYTFAACFTVGLAAYIEGHGCALQPETCVEGGFPLMAQVAIWAAIFYFGPAWLVNRSTGRSRPPPADHSLRVAGGAEGRQEGE